jgi:predicted ArsR family transcriptional regulator
MDRVDAGIAVLGSLDDPVRHRLYKYVAARDRPVCRDEAAGAAGIGRPLAAYHLDKLVELGLLTASYQRPPGRRGPGAGRPKKHYVRSAAEFAVSVPPRDYELAARLLAAAVASDDSGTSQAALEEAARRFGASLGHRREATGDAVGGAVGGAAGDGAGDGGPEDALAVLTEHGFEPFRDEDGTIRLRNCPFHQLAAEHPAVVCGMTLALVDGVITGALPCDLETTRPASTALHPVLEPRPGCCCVALAAGRPESDDDTGES